MGAREVYVQVSNLHQRDIREHIHHSLYRIDGIDSLDCDDRRHQIYFRIDEDKVSQQTIVDTIKNAGGHVVFLRSRYPYRALDVAWLYALLFANIIYFSLYIAYIHTSFWSSWRILIQGILLLLMLIGYFRIRRNLRVTNIRDESTLLSQYIFFGWMGLSVLYVVQLFIFDIYYIDMMLISIMHLWFLLHSIIAIVFMIYRWRVSEKTAGWIEAKIQLFAKFVIMEDRSTLQSATIIVRGDRFRLIANESILPVDAILCSSWCHVHTEGTRYAAVKGQKILAGSYIETMDSLFEASVDFSSSILMYEKCEYKYNSSTHHRLNSSIQGSFNIWFCWVGYLLFFLIAWFALQHYPSISPRVRWSGYSLVLLSLGLFWLPYWREIVRIVGYKIFQDDIARLGVVCDNANAFYRSKERKTFWIHLRAFPLVPDWRQAKIISETHVPLMESLLCEVVGEKHKNNLQQDQAKAEVICYEDGVDIIYDTERYRGTLLRGEELFIMHGMNQSDEVVNDNDSYHWYQFMNSANECIGYMVVPLILSDTIQELVKRAIDYNLIVVLAGDMSQHVLNNLARDVGVLETYGNCDDTRLGELLRKYMHKGESLITIMPPSFNQNNMGTKSTFFEVRELESKDQTALGNVAYFSKFDANRIVSFIYLLQNFDVYYRYLSKVLAFIVFLVYTVAIAYIIFTHQNLIELAVVVSIVGVLSIMSLHHFYIWYRRKAQRTVQK
ncbi:hypothetical protein PVA44_06205 [Entomospira nematocerorum]|uniref:Uncharacterized protein n=1 Tax=Entomospira nematocerorum TaxID=2719987 RepID=A0A968GAM9_9SPIO|nr:hypothetical protein [Entomospira nematocera]NIZ46387.1 hypothetical protein [Entomospira nematocera]WDI33809.1 hypothetical protein PVA44_06205 [Entomospira nematocera]